MQPSREKSAGLGPSPKRSLRIGYVNVNGLDQLKWVSCLRILHVSFDFLFLAETWFVGHTKYVCDRRLLSSTPLPSPSLQCTRNGGGLYLLASASARDRLLDDVKGIILLRKVGGRKGYRRYKRFLRRSLQNTLEDRRRTASQAEAPATLSSLYPKKMWREKFTDKMQTRLAAWKASTCASSRLYYPLPTRPSSVVCSIFV